MAPFGSLIVPVLSKPSRVVFDGSPEVVPEATTCITEAVCVSLRSTSVKLNVPVLLSALAEPISPGCSVSDAVCTELVINGAWLTTGTTKFRVVAVIKPFWSSVVSVRYRCLMPRRDSIAVIAIYVDRQRSIYTGDGVERGQGRRTVEVSCNRDSGV